MEGWKTQRTLTSGQMTRAWKKVDIAVCDRDGSVLFVDALSGTLGQWTEQKAAHAQTGENGPRKSWDR